MSEKEAQNLLFSGEIFIKTEDIHDNKIDEDLVSVNKQIETVNEELERLVSHANKEDYAIAVSSGIIATTIDSLFVGKFDLEQANNVGEEKVENFIKHMAKIIVVPFF